MIVNLIFHLRSPLYTIPRSNGFFCSTLLFEVMEFAACSLIAADGLYAAGNQAQPDQNNEHFTHTANKKKRPKLEKSTLFVEGNFNGNDE